MKILFYVLCERRKLASYVKKKLLHPMAYA